MVQITLKDYIDQLPIIDVHEHLISDTMRLEKYKDYISLLIANYLRTGAVSGGTTEAEIAFLQGDNPLPEKYICYKKAVEPLHNTWVFKGLDMAFLEIYGVSILDEDYEKVNAAYVARNKLGITNEIATQFHIQAAVNDVFFPTMQSTDYHMDQTILRNSARCDRFILVQENFDNLSEEFSVPITSLAQWKSLLDAYLKMQVEEYHAIAIKIGTAYDRTLFFEEVTEQDAAATFHQLLQARAQGIRLDLAQIKPLEDYMAHYVIAAAGSHHLPVQIHTGMFESNLCYLANSNPLLLNNIFVKFPTVVFDVFHISFPFSREAGAMARMFPNVYVNFSWAYTVAPDFANQILKEYIGFLSANKFCIFGGDFMHIEGSCGQLIVIKQRVTELLTEMIQRGEISLEGAKKVAYQIFYENPKQIYKV